MESPDYKDTCEMQKRPRKRKLAPEYLQGWAWTCQACWTLDFQVDPGCGDDYSAHSSRRGGQFYSLGN